MLAHVVGKRFRFADTRRDEGLEVTDLIPQESEFRVDRHPAYGKHFRRFLC